MRALLLDSGPSGDLLTTAAADSLAAELERRGFDVERVVLRDLSVRACTGCFGCWTRRPGECVIDDDARSMAEKAIAADVLAWATPVRFGTFNSIAKSVIDRMICLVLPHFTFVDGEVHHRPRYARYPRVLALGTSSDASPAERDLFARLVSRQAINLHNPAHASAVIAHERDAADAARVLADGALAGAEVAA